MDSDRGASVKNKAPADQQITSEQILRESQQYKEVIPPTPAQVIQDVQELRQYQSDKRKDFEDNVRRHPHNIAMWIKYGIFEAKQKDYERARSVFERVIDIDYRNPVIWIKYAEMEMKARFINRARNVWDRAVGLLPRMDQLWLKYSLMEEQLDNITGARQVFERWMKWKPDSFAWMAYLRLEIRQSNASNGRDILERMLLCHPEVGSYLKYQRFEEQYGTVNKARRVLERCCEEIGRDSYVSQYFLIFAKFEQRHRELDRSRMIYEFGLKSLKDLAEDPECDSEAIAEDAVKLYDAYILFQKRFGTFKGVEGVVLEKQRSEYEELVGENEFNYDAWFDYIRMEQQSGESTMNFELVREVYERAIANVPPINEKRHWRRYIYLWIYYALFEELITHDVERTREIYKTCLDIIPHSEFTFSKIWIMYCHFEIRQSDLNAARRILGVSIGKCPTTKLFKTYIALESGIGDFVRCRILYLKYIEFSPDSCDAWIAFAELEEALGEYERVRSIYELAIHQPVLDMPELLWKSYINFEMSIGNHEKARQLYSRLLDRSKHVKVWVSTAQFETEVGDIERAREVYKRGSIHFKRELMKEDRLLVLEAWRQFEKLHGTATTLSIVDGSLPERIKKKRPIFNVDGTDAGFEEYYDYIFPDENAKADLKFLHAAKLWKRQKKVSRSIPTTKT